MTPAAVIREMEERGVRLHLDGDCVRWRGRMPQELLTAAREHRDAIAGYLRRQCTGCSRTRLIMVLMESGGSPWWLCSTCWREGAR